jgi:GH25 family lysozyme M1 (1,4-beta-N-acetylmuramidase)
VTRPGIDIASYQHPGGAQIVWPDVKSAGIEWVAVKLTEDTDYVNPYGEADAHNAIAEGLEVVLYHFARPTRNAAADEARWFANHIPAGLAGCRKALDLEDGRQLGWAKLATWATEFADVLALELLYVPGSYAAALLAYGFPWGIPVWAVANSSGEPTTGVAVLQHGEGSVAGIDGPVDLDEVYYEPASVPAPAPAPESPPPAPVGLSVPELVATSSGPAVRALQALLNEHGGQLAVDGEFGPATYLNVHNYQTAKGLTVDGIVGPQTWESLLTT